MPERTSKIREMPFIPSPTSFGENLFFCTIYLLNFDSVLFGVAKVCQMLGMLAKRRLRITFVTNLWVSACLWSKKAHSLTLQVDYNRKNVVSCFSSDFFFLLSLFGCLLCVYKLRREKSQSEKEVPPLNFGSVQSKFHEIMELVFVFFLSSAYSLSLLLKSDGSFSAANGCECSQYCGEGGFILLQLERDSYLYRVGRLMAQNCFPFLCFFVDFHPFFPQRLCFSHLESLFPTL